ncbi:hypothetical protein Tco_0230268, partial [Tanacetum coccineum]
MTHPLDIHLLLSFLILFQKLPVGILEVINPVKKWVHKESVSKQGRKFAKGEPSVHRDPLFDEIPEDILDYMETENAQDVGRTRDIVGEEKENDEDVLISTDGSKVSTGRQIEGTEEQVEGAKEQVKGTDEHKEGIEEHNEGTEEKVESTDGQIK